MSILFQIIGMIIGAICACYNTRKFFESIFNLMVGLEDKNYYDSMMLHQGIVLNKRTKKLEADNSLKKPF